MTNAYERVADVFITARKELADLPINRPVARPSPAPRSYPFLERMKKKMEEEAKQVAGFLGKTPLLAERVEPAAVTGAKAALEIGKGLTAPIRGTRLPGTDIYLGGSPELAAAMQEMGSAEALRLQPTWQQVAQALPATAAMGGIWMGPSASAAGVKAGQLARQAAPVVKQAGRNIAQAPIGPSAAAKASGKSELLKVLDTANMTMVEKPAYPVTFDVNHGFSFHVAKVRPDGWAVVEDSSGSWFGFAPTRQAAITDGDKVLKSWEPERFKAIVAGAQEKRRVLEGQALAAGQKPLAEAAPAAKPQTPANEATLLAELKRLERREDLHSAQYGRTVAPWGQTSPNYGAPVSETSAAGKSWIRFRATQERSDQIMKELENLRAAKAPTPAAGSLTRGVSTEPAGVAKPLFVAPTPAQAPAPATRAVTPPQPAAPPQAATGGGAAQPPQKPPTSVTPPEPLPTGKPGKSLEQADEAITRFSKFLTSPETENAWDMTVQLRKEALGQRIARFQARADELVVQGKSTEEAVTQATRETMSGTLPSTTTDLTTELRDALFAKVYHTLQDEPFEMISTSEALTNALLGKPIPRIPGTAGGSAYSRLLRVFGDTPEVVERLTKGKKIEDLVEEAAFASAKKPLHTDAELEAALARIRQLPTIPHGQARLGEGSFVFRGLSPRGTPLEQAESLIDTVKATYPDIRTLPEADRDVLLQTLRSTGVNDADLGRLQLDLWPSTPPRPVPVYEAPIEAAVKQPSLMPLEAEHQIIAALKEVGMTVADIGNFLRANKASVDFSFWRQQAPLILNHKRDFATANVQAWKALWSEKAAAESWKRITQDPLFGLYDELGLDFLRPYEMPGKATRYRGVEEFGYLTADRPISAFTSKLPHVKVSQRAFVTGVNEHNWRIFKSFYADMLKVNEGVASGLVKMKPGQAFSIKNNLRDYGKMLQDFTGRASLGKARELGPALGGLVFAPRYALGRLISPRHLFSGNKYVRAAAWKNAATFVSGFGSIIALGEQMNLWDVEWDPRSSDFAKIRIGNTRIDPWGGYQQFARFFAQVATNTGVGVDTREQYKMDPLQALTRFLRGKASPLAGLITDLRTGKTYVGEKVNLTSPKQWVDRVIPLLPMDIYEAIKAGGPLRGAIVALPGAVGAGISTYGNLEQLDAAATNLGLLGATPANLEQRQALYKAYFALPTNAREANAKRLPSRQSYRRTHPDVDAKLFITGQVESLATGRAKSMAVALMKETGIGVEDIKGLEKEPYESIDRTRLRRYFEDWLRPSEKPQTNTQKWQAVSRQMSGTTLQALLNLWSPQRRPLPLAEEQRLRAIFAQYPLGQTNFDTWLKQTLRQLQENAAVESSKQSSPTSGIQLAPLRGTLQPVGGR